MRFLFPILLATALVSCGKPQVAPERPKWEGYSEHEKIFECMYSGEYSRFPDSIKPTEDYAVIILGHYESEDVIPEVSAILATRESGTIETAVGLNAIRKLFAKIRPKSTIRGYAKCMVSLTYGVPESKVEKTFALIPSGLIWCGTFNENFVCNCRGGPRNFSSANVSARD